jgi:hypothetical protein
VPARKTVRASRRKSIEGVRISPDDRVSLYAQSQYLPGEFKKNAGLRLPFTTYFDDPFVAKLNPEKGIDSEAYADWEPGLSDGPTSSRFAVVDFNADTGKLEAPAAWNDRLQQFTTPDGKPLDKSKLNTPAYHQVNVWVLLQRALAVFEGGNSLGRRISWGFEGNRLIVVPHAGFGENAYYDRESKSLQFYYFGSTEDPVYTCLSTDIVSHEFGHAVLDGVRPLLNESGSVETAAFHEFFGDLSALTMTLHNNALRRMSADESGGDFDKATNFASLAEEFGQALLGRPYLRSFINDYTMAKMAGAISHHKISQVLSGAIYDILKRLGKHYSKGERGKTPKSPRQVFWLAADRLQRLTIQPLDLLPPVEVNFRDYALAACRSQQLAEPIDPDGYLGMLVEVFVKRGVLNQNDADALKQPDYVHKRLELSVHHNIENIARSRAAAYRFLDDNREDLLIPTGRDFIVADLYDAHKRGRQNLALPRQIVLQYVWREDVKLDGKQFGKFDGQRTTMLCGGTLVFDDNGVVLCWAMKPGSIPYGGVRQRSGRVAQMWQNALVEGKSRREKLLEDIATQIAAGRVGNIIGSAKGLLGTMVPPLLANTDADGVVRFQLAPHMHLSEEHQLEDETGEHQWQISC